MPMVISTSVCSEAKVNNFIVTTTKCVFLLNTICTNYVTDVESLAPGFNLVATLNTCFTGIAFHNIGSSKSQTTIKIPKWCTII